jgi:hypothetical protein
MQLVNNSIAPGSLAKRFPPPEVVRILGLGKKGDDRRGGGPSLPRVLLSWCPSGNLHRRNEFHIIKAVEAICGTSPELRAFEVSA